MLLLTIGFVNFQGFRGPKCEEVMSKCEVGDLICYNGGTCVVDMCNCLSGFGGIECQYKIKDQPAAPGKTVPDPKKLPAVGKCTFWKKFC